MEMVRESPPLIFGHGANLADTVCNALSRGLLDAGRRSRRVCVQVPKANGFAMEKALEFLPGSLETFRLLEWEVTGGVLPITQISTQI